jgi:hypothetical protein
MDVLRGSPSPPLPWLPWLPRLLGASYSPRVGDGRGVLVPLHSPPAVSASTGGRPRW